MEQHSQQRRAIVLLVLVGLAILPIFYLNLTAIRSSDDYGYSTFWMNGPAEFLRLTVRHYNITNGRALVHFVAQTVLAFPPIVFATLNTALLFGTAVLSGWIQGAAKQSVSLSWAIFFFLTFLLLLPVSILKEGLLWASASYNYMFPPVFNGTCTVASQSVFSASAKGPHLFALLCSVPVCGGSHH